MSNKNIKDFIHLSSSVIHNITSYNSMYYYLTHWTKYCSMWLTLTINCLYCWFHLNVKWDTCPCDLFPIVCHSRSLCFASQWQYHSKNIYIFEIEMYIETYSWKLMLIALHESLVLEHWFFLFSINSIILTPSPMMMLLLTQASCW